MSTAATAAISFLSAIILLTLWYMFFIMEIPYSSIGDASDQSWYKQAYWGLLLSSIVSLVTVASLVVFGMVSLFRGAVQSALFQRFVPIMLLLSAAGTAYGFYVLATFIFVTC